MTARGSEALRYRPEIDGLRAIALLPVTLFHAGFASFGGGFVGVDVFFVISGYLITTIIVTDRKAGTFSLARFYERRARRILPALLFVMLACLPFAWAWMLPDDLENFGQSLVATTFFSNNVLLWLTSGYFEMAADFKPLAHTWSLGLEEQYYVVFPLLIAVIWPLGRRRLLGTLAVLGVASLAAAEWGSTRDDVANFVLLPTRGWELLIGSAVALYLLGRQTADAPTPARRVIENVAGSGWSSKNVLADCGSPRRAARAVRSTAGCRHDGHPKRASSNVGGGGTRNSGGDNSAFLRAPRQENALECRSPGHSGQSRIARDVLGHVDGGRRRIENGRLCSTYPQPIDSTRDRFLHKFLQENCIRERFRSSLSGAGRSLSWNRPQIARGDCRHFEPNGQGRRWAWGESDVGHERLLAKDCS